MFFMFYTAKNLQEPSLETASSYMFIEGDDANPVQTTSNTAYTYKYIDFGSQSDNIWLTIPEPTSGILLALGVAVLALRRKKVA